MVPRPSNPRHRTGPSPVGRLLAILALALLTVPFAHAPASAAWQTFHVDSTNLTLPAPCLALEPLTGIAHVGYRDNTSLLHAWGSPGSWSIETITTDGSSLDWVIDGAGVPAAAYVKSGGVIALARPGAGGWSEDTVAVLPGWVLSSALALAPGTEEPVVAWMGQVPATSPVRMDVMIARRVAGTWTFATVDSFTNGIRMPPALEIAPDGTPRLSYLAGVASTTELRYASAAGPLGPFAYETIDPLGFTRVAMALDPASAEPRVAYFSWDDTLATFLVRYGWREGGAWQRLNAGDTGGGLLGYPVSLALDAFGSPAIAFARLDPILEQPKRGDAPASVLACAGSVESATTVIARRAEATGFAPFPPEYTPGYNQIPSRRSLARLPFGPLRLVASSPPQNGCTYQVSYLAETGTLGVSDSAEPPLTLAAPSPNPWRPGSPLALELALATAGTVRVELVDVAGRVLARAEFGRRGAGAHRLSWDPGELPPGCYWIRAHADDRSVRTRALVVLR